MNLIKKFKLLLSFLCLLCVFINTTLARQSDNGNGTYTNPPLYADFPDPDIIRVGEDFYFATTTFVNTPGLTILHSKDLVNWKYLSHVIDRLDGRPEYDLQDGTAYRSGVFAPSLRFKDGTFYVVVTPVGQNTRIYTAKDASGPWSYTELDRGAFDPGLFFDDDGKGYVATSAGYDGTLTLLTLNEDYTEVIDAKEVFFNRGAEGSKIIKRGDWYYLFQSIPRRLGMDISRAKSLFGPWETKRSIDDRTGGHQGAIVDLPDGSWYGFVMCDFESVGRITNISPIFWQDDWPIWGTPDAQDKVPSVATKPIQGKPVMQPATSDDFSSETLGLQWQWNHNPDHDRWSLSERPGFLRLKATQSDQFWTAQNTLTQKGWGPWCQGTVTLDLSQLKPGDICGFGTLGKFNGHTFITCNEEGELFLGMQVMEDVRNGQETKKSGELIPIQKGTILLRTEMEFITHKAKNSYSLDGQTWTEAGTEFPLEFDWQTGTFQGQQFAIFCYNPKPSEGFIDVDSFLLTDEKPVSLQTVSFDYFEYTGEDINATSPLTPGQYRNPILAGFHPDPSICRAGDDYYLINSTFEYFPGLPIFHSKDLVNWKQIGHVIHRPEQLNFRNRRVSTGLFAPAITYHDGFFYVVCTKIDGPGNFVVTAENPAGPWSDPVPLEFGGIDPSIFFDDDGTAWMVYNDAPEGRPLYDGHRAVWIQQFDPQNKKMYESRKLLINGGVDLSKKPVWIEGPHIYKLNGWYYLCCAEGGTSTQHSQVIFRSKDVDGPYKPWEQNPIMTQRDLDGNVPNAVTSTGHADLVIGPDGNWWAVFLAVRPYKDGLSPMGRETFLLPVTWTDDDWPLILPQGERVPLLGKSPNGVDVEPTDKNPLNDSFTWRDNFNNNELSLEWIMLREPEEEWWNVNTAMGHLELIPRSETLVGSGNPSFLGRRVRHAKYTATTSLDVPGDGGVSAGLTLFMNERHHYYLAVQRKEDGIVLYLEKVDGRETSRIAETELNTLDEIELRVQADKESCSFLYKINGRDWETLVDEADAKIITSAVRDGMFLGATVGPHVRIDGIE